MSDTKWLKGRKAISKRYGVSVITIKRWLKDKGMPGSKVGRDWLFDTDDTDAWIKKYN